MQIARGAIPADTPRSIYFIAASIRLSFPDKRRDAVQDIAAVGALGLIGEASDAALVRAALNKGGSRLRPAAETALKRIAEREGGAVK